MNAFHLFQNNDFELRPEAGRLYFVHRASQARVRTDALGRAIWESLPGTEEEVVRKSIAITGAQRNLARDFLRVMLRAEVVGCAGGEKERRPETGKEATMTAEGAEEAKMKDSGLVSVIIIAYNSQEHIQGCLESVLGQTYKNFEVIVVDNASKDRTVRIVESYRPLVRIFPLQKNLYFPGGVNYGIEKAGGEFFLVLNDDLELDSRCVARLVEKMRLEEQAGAVVPMMRFYHLRGFVNGIGNQIRQCGWGSDNFIGCVDVGQFHGLGEVPSACFGAVLLRRKAVGDVGLLDAGYKSYYEDSDWSFRCWMRGWKIVPQVDALVFHKFGAHWKPLAPKLKLVSRNRLRLVLKLFQGRTLLRFLRRYLSEDVRNSLSLLRRIEFRPAAAYLEAYVSLALSLPGIFLQRQKFFRRKRPHLRVNDILRKNPEPISCLNDENVPVLDSRVISGYYSQYLKE